MLCATALLFETTICNPHYTLHTCYFVLWKQLLFLIVDSFRLLFSMFNLDDINHRLNGSDVKRKWAEVLRRCHRHHLINNPGDEITVLSKPFSV